VIDFALGVAVITLGVGFVATLALRLLPTVRLQLSGLALLAVLLPLLAVMLSNSGCRTPGNGYKRLSLGPHWSALVAQLLPVSRRQNSEGRSRLGPTQRLSCAQKL